MPVKPQEPTLGPRDRPPKGYVFLPKGNVYLTTNSRRQTQAASRQVFTQLDESGKNATGLHIPSHIFHAVAAAERASRAARAAAVRKRDDTAARALEAAVRRQFPGAPEADVPRSVKHAMVKGRRRVARTATLGLEERVRLAVWAHVRHCCTGYDELLRDGVEREAARREVRGTMDEVLMTWGRKKDSTVGGRPVRRAAIESSKKTGSLFGAGKAGKKRVEKKGAGAKQTARGRSIQRRGTGLVGRVQAKPGFSVSDDDSDWTP